MRILYITPFFQHPLMQGPTRHYHFIRELSRRHTITLLTPTRSPIPPEAMEEMATYTERMLVFDTIRRRSPTSGNGMGFFSKLLRKGNQVRRNREAIREMQGAFLRLMREESYDLILFHGKSLFSVIEDWDRHPIVTDFCDATSLRIIGAMRYSGVAEIPWLMWRYLRIRQLEKKLVRKTPYLAFISARDRDAILEAGSEAKIVPNFVDLQYWKRKTTNPESNCIMYSGGMDYRPNVDGALYLIKRILPLVRQSIPNPQVFIVGRDPSPELVETAQDYPDVTITGSVEDMRPYFERATVCAAPMRFASGQQNKLLEAMAMEVPVVTTPVAAAGVRVDGAEPPLVVTEGDKKFANAILRLLSSEQERARLASEGRRYIKEHFGWSSSAEMLENMCIDAVEQSYRGRK